MAGYLRTFFQAVERTWLPVGDAVRQAAARALAGLGRVAAEGRAAIRQVAAEVAAKAKPLLSKIEQEGERAAGTTNARVEQQAGAEAAGRPPEPDGPEPPNDRGEGTVKTRNLQKRLDEHRQKLEDYRRDPYAYDNDGRLRNAPNDEVRNRIIQGRIRHLEQEIRAFEKGIRDVGGVPR